MIIINFSQSHTILNNRIVFSKGPLCYQVALTLTVKQPYTAPTLQESYISKEVVLYDEQA